MNLKEIVDSSILSETPEDEALLQKAETARDQARATTKGIKWDDTAIDIMSAVGSIADDLSVEEVTKELEYLENAVFQAKNELESAIYGLEEPFDDLIRTLQNRIDDEEMDRQDAEYDARNSESVEESEPTMLNPTSAAVRNTKVINVVTKSNTTNERKVAKLLRTVLVNEDAKLDVYELFSLLQSEKPELVEVFKSVALTTYDVQLDEGNGRIRKGLGIGALIMSLLGINALAPTAKDGELGKALHAHVQQGGEDSDLAQHYYKALDVYADAGGQRTLINLNIKFNPNFKTNRVSYDPNRQDVEDFLRKQAKLPEPAASSKKVESRQMKEPWWSKN